MTSDHYAMADKMGKPTRPAPRRPSADWALAVDVVMRLGVSVVAGLFVGFLVDGWLSTSPLFTLVGLALGLGGAGYTIWDVSKRNMSR